MWSLGGHASCHVTDLTHTLTFPPFSPWHSEQSTRHSKAATAADHAKERRRHRQLRMQHNRTGWPLTWRKAPKFLVSEGWLLWNAKCTTGHCFTRASNKYEKMKWRKNAVAPQFTTRVIVSLSTIQACTIYSKTNFSIHLTWKEYFKHKNTPHPAQG